MRKQLLLTLGVLMAVVPGLTLAQTNQDPLGDGTYVKKDFSFYDSVIRKNTLLGGYGDVASEGPAVTAAVIVNFLLSLLGTFCLALAVYAGFLWMTAQGNEDSIKKAKDILTGTVVGLFVILSSYAFMSFVFRSFTSITN